MKRLLQTMLGLAVCAAVSGANLAYAADVRGEKVANAHTYRASKLVGMSVRNAEGEKIGTIDDLVLNMDNGQISYAALGFGGVLGFGEKLFAVPFKQLKMEHSTNDSYFVLNVNKDKLKAAPGFDKNHWPDLADPNWSKDIDSYYRQATTTATTKTIRTSESK
jgi:sporulation protein YlmC with PRC-barrel domain